MSEHKKTHQGLRKKLPLPILSTEHTKLQENLLFSHGQKNSKFKSSKFERNNTVVTLLSEQAKSIFQNSISIQCEFCKILFKKQKDLDNHLSSSDCHGRVVIKEETKESQNYLGNEHEQNISINNSNGILSESGTYALKLLLNFNILHNYY